LLVVEQKEIVGLIDVMSMMDVLISRVELVGEDYLLMMVDQDVDDYKYNLLVQMLLVGIVNYYNHLVVFYDNNLIRQEKNTLFEK
jgi:hypothetical protein